MEKDRSSQQSGSPMDSKPYAFAFREHLTGSIRPRSPARTVPDPFGTSLAAYERGVAEYAFAAALAAEHGDLDQILTAQHEGGENPLPPLQGSLVSRNPANLIFQ